jgi:hypothetical protein
MKTKPLFKTLPSAMALNFVGATSEVLARTNASGIVQPRIEPRDGREQDVAEIPEFELRSYGKPSLEGEFQPQACFSTTGVLQLTLEPCDPKHSGGAQAGKSR